jgi:hypothetical protein
LIRALRHRDFWRRYECGDAFQAMTTSSALIGGYSRHCSCRGTFDPAEALGTKIGLAIFKIRDLCRSQRLCIAISPPMRPRWLMVGFNNVGGRRRRG